MLIMLVEKKRGRERELPRYTYIYLLIKINFNFFFSSLEIIITTFAFIHHSGMSCISLNSYRKESKRDVRRELQDGAIRLRYWRSLRYHYEHSISDFWRWHFP